MKVHAAALAVIALIASTFTPSMAHSDDGPDFDDDRVVVTEAGAVRGIANSAVVAFLGIPYAEPPVGNLRWRPPVPRSHWTGVLDAAQPGKHCPQPPTVDDPNASEACLFLNVHVPREVETEHHSQRLPVMVWIHGGQNVSGASEIYDPTPLALTGDVIAVTLNYRLGALGFLAHPALDAEGHGFANYGLQDQQLALRWVRTNIRRFGGDPDKVTIFGESSGGLNVLSHLISPQSAGLYGGAIIQSGAYQPNTASLSASEGLGITLSNAVGCADQTAACLRAASVADIVAHAANAFNQSTVDGQVLPETQLAALAAGHVNRVPVMQGANSHEGRFFVSPALSQFGYQLTIFGIAAATGKPADQVFLRYSFAAVSSSFFEAASVAYGDAAFACTAAASSQRLAPLVPTWAFEFDDAAASQLGAMHSAELKYLFNLNLGGPPVGPASLPSTSQALAARMRDYWTQFARTGNPNSRGAPEWNRISDGQVQSLTAPSPSSQSLADYRARHQCAFWD